MKNEREDLGLAEGGELEYHPPPNKGLFFMNRVGQGKCPPEKEEYKWKFL